MTVGLFYGATQDPSKKTDLPDLVPREWNMAFTRAARTLSRKRQFLARFSHPDGRAEHADFAWFE
jgi:hypothetical protein